MKLRPIVRGLCLCGLLAGPFIAAHGATTGAAAFDALVAQRWEYQLKESPELATTIGDYRYNDRWTDYSPPTWWTTARPPRPS